MRLVRIGRLGRPHGLNGELALDSAGLAASELLAIGEFTWRGKKGESRALKIHAVRSAIPRMLVRFAGVDSRARAAELVNGELLVEEEKLPDPGPGMAYTFQLIGLDVTTEDGRRLGSLEEIIATGANPVYVVRGEREILIPATAEVLKRVDLETRTITVSLPAGLEEIQ